MYLGQTDLLDIQGVNVAVHNDSCCCCTVSFVALQYVFLTDSNVCVCYTATSHVGAQRCVLLSYIMCVVITVCVECAVNVIAVQRVLLL